MSTAAEQERLSRREVLALTLLALLPLPIQDVNDREIVVVDGWVLRRSDLAQL